MKKAQPEIERIEKKYRNRTDNEALMAKSQEIMMIYKKYKVNPMTKISFCNIWSVSSNFTIFLSSSIINFLFPVKPLAYLILQLGNLVRNLGISLILIGLAIRLILLPFTIKSTKQAQNMKKAQPEIERIEKKKLKPNNVSS